VVWLVSRHDLNPLRVGLEGLRAEQERSEARLRDELRRQAGDAAASARALREEVASAVKQAGESIVHSVGEISSVQRLQLETFAGQLVQLRTEVTAAVRTFNESVTATMGAMSQAQGAQLEQAMQQLRSLQERHEQRMQVVQQSVDSRLRELRDDNAQQLERMRATVDEKLHATLEQRLGESFRLVSDRLDAVHKGLGEMQSLASGVGDLKRVLSNVKTRGTWGEIQLGNLLEQVLAPEQYEANVATRPDTSERVEYAVKLPGRSEDRNEVVWLPIDAKFPQEDYHRLLEAQEQGDAAAVQEAGRRLEAQVKACAKTIADKYVHPPSTTDFAIMFLPTEGLYAEVVRRPGTVEMLQRDHRIVVAGPTTLAALLNSLQMGFRTLAVERRSSEVWSLLGAVKSEFHKFGGVLDKVHKKLHEATNSIDNAARRTRVIERKLRKVEELPVSGAQPSLFHEPDPPEDEEAG
jgi:DNA recombination protein RmuC